MPDQTALTVPLLINCLGHAAMPVIVDVCIDADFAEDPVLIPGAFRHHHRDLAALAQRLEDRPSVIVCQRGRKLSQGVAAWLRSEGLSAQYLDGGMVAWRAHPATAAIPAAALPGKGTIPTVWAAPRHCNDDCLAAIWLIRRFVDRWARVLFVDRDEVANVAERFDASALEEPETATKLHSGTGPFRGLVDRLGLHLDPLTRLERVLRRNTQDKQSTLAAMLYGLRHQHPDDTELVKASLPVFDALFIWAKAEGAVQ